MSNGYDNGRKEAMEIKQVRIKQGITRAELAFRCGCSVAMIRAIECGYKNPSIKLAQKIADSMNTSIESLIFCPKDKQKA
jgi:DNA-binding XRE family transcriptional regulator